MRGKGSLGVSTKAAIDLATGPCYGARMSARNSGHSRTADSPGSPVQSVGDGQAALHLPAAQDGSLESQIPSAGSAPRVGRAPAKPGKLGRSVPLQAEGLDSQGAGVGWIAGRLVHVSGLLPGERADVQVQHESAHTVDAWGTVNRRLSDSPDRTVPPCAGYGLCGGCSLQHLGYEAQLRWKQEQLTQALRDLSGFGGSVQACVSASAAAHSTADIAPAAVVAAASVDGSDALRSLPLGYRSRVKLVAAEKKGISPKDVGGRVYLGAYVPRSHTVLAMEGCKVNAPALTAIGQTLTQALNQLGIAAYDEATAQGCLRYVLLRESGRGEQQLGLVVAEPPPATTLAQLTQALTAQHPTLVSIVLHQNRSPGNALLADDEQGLGAQSEDRCLHGEPHLWEDVGGIALRISARSFFQVHRAVAARIYADVRAQIDGQVGGQNAGQNAGQIAGQIRSSIGAAKGADDALRVLDVYCGVGGLGLTLAAQIPRIQLRGLEWSASAVADAMASAAGLGLSDRAQFYRGSAESLLADPDLVAWAAGCAAVLLNPPRRGCTPAVLSALLTLRPRNIVYVSCSPENLARDVLALTRAGYTWLHSTPYDMHPGTPHIESVTLLVDSQGARAG